MDELDQYDYELPRELIAQHPLANRSDARLMVVDRKAAEIHHSHVRCLPELLSSGDCLVLNDTRVIPARLIGRRTTTGGRWQGLYLVSDSTGVWKVMCKTRGQLTEGETVTLEGRDSRDGVQLVLLARLEPGIWAVRPESDAPTLELLEQFGRVPLPPYIRGGEMLPEDVEDYQTVFSRQPGAVAAPTAGLHFTKELLDELQRSGVDACHVTLHVGHGTFRPISVPRLSEHPLHSEWCCVDESCVQSIGKCRERGGRVVAVGTTVMRTLETSAASGTLEPWSGETDLFIRPPFEFHAVDALLTNFHLPKSSLLVLVRTFGGDRLIRQAYELAIEEDYRFYSYGDAMLVM